MRPHVYDLDRPALIVDVRRNSGGKIDSFILDALLRKAWMYWKGRAGQPTRNMHYALRGHMVVLVDEQTPINLIETIKPDVLVTGADYKKDQVVGWDIVEGSGGRGALAPLIVTVLKGIVGA